MTPYNGQVCGTCKHCKRDYTEKGAPFTCHNEQSEMYGLMTAFDDACDEYEEKE